MSLTTDLNNALSALNTWGTNVNSEALSSSSSIINENLLDNSDFSIWQRGNSFSESTVQWRYLADRWLSCSSSASRQEFSPGQTDVPGNARFFMRMEIDPLINNAHSFLEQLISGGIRRLAGKEVTLSFYAKSSIAGNKLACFYGQDFGTGGSPSDYNSTETDTFTLSTEWQRFASTFTFDDISGKTFGTDNNDRLWVALAVSNYGECHCGDGGLGTQTGIFDISNVKLELGSIATDYERKDPNLELQKCLSYYCNSYSSNTLVGTGTVIGAKHLVAASTCTWDYIAFPTKMKSIPIVTIYSTLNGAPGYITTSGDANISASIINTGQASSNIIFSSTVGLGYRYHWTADCELTQQNY